MEKFDDPGTHRKRQQKFDKNKNLKEHMFGAHKCSEKKFEISLDLTRDLCYNIMG